MKSYLKFLSRNKLYTVIEAVGLVVSLAFVIVIGASLRDQLRIAEDVPGGKSGPPEHALYGIWGQRDPGFAARNRRGRRIYSA